MYPAWFCIFNRLGGGGGVFDADFRGRQLMRNTRQEGDLDGEGYSIDPPHQG